MERDYFRLENWRPASANGSRRARADARAGGWSTLDQLSGRAA